MECVVEAMKENDDIVGTIMLWIVLNDIYSYFSC
jgi:hypothetical protein